jgi:hypothetical protein
LALLSQVALKEINFDPKVKPQMSMQLPPSHLPIEQKSLGFGVPTMQHGLLRKGLS